MAEGGAASRTVVLNSHPTGNATMDVDARPLPTDRCWGDLALRGGRGCEGGGAPARQPQCLTLGMLALDPSGVMKSLSWM